MYHSTQNNLWLNIIFRNNEVDKTTVSLDFLDSKLLIVSPSTSLWLLIPNFILDEKFAVFNPSAVVMVGIQVN